MFGAGQKRKVDDAIARQSRVAGELDDGRVGDARRDAREQFDAGCAELAAHELGGRRAEGAQRLVLGVTTVTSDCSMNAAIISASS